MLAVVGLGLLVWLLLREAFTFVLLVFAGVLFAIFLDGVTGWVADHLNLGRGVALAGVLVGGLLLFGAGGWWLGPPVAGQLQQLAERIPEAASSIQEWLRDRGWGEMVLERMSPEEGGRGTDIMGRVTGVFSSTLSLFVNTFIVLFIGIYLAASPRLYRDPVLRLLPQSGRERGGDVASALGEALRSWLTGRLASMAVVGVITAAGLLLLGVPLALGLALLAGLLSFVPFLGPIAAAIPAVAVAYLESPGLVLWVVLLYWGTQLVESYLITPLIQQRVVSMPPAALLAAQILMGVIAGTLGILLATPLLLTVVVLVQMLYLEEVREEEVSVAGG